MEFWEKKCQNCKFILQSSRKKIWIESFYYGILGENVRIVSFYNGILGKKNQNWEFLSSNSGENF